MPKQLWKSTIVIWSEFDPRPVELRQLAGEAEDGSAYCSFSGFTLVEDPSGDPDWDGTEFFDGYAQDDDASTVRCRECGAEMFVENDGISHHSSDDNIDGIDYDADADHVAVLEEGEARVKIPGRMTARFVAQAWVGDNAIDVDPQGETEWDCSEGFDSLSDDYRRALCDEIAVHGEALDCDDELKTAETAPEWVRDWSGPFSLYVRPGPATIAKLEALRRDAESAGPAT